MILDEVQCGMGRTGTIMTYFQYDILPDILCLAKGIGAGFPMGAFVANKKFAAAMEPGDHGSTYGGNPMAGQACRTVFKILEETKMLDHVQDISEYLIEKLDDLKDKYDKNYTLKYEVNLFVDNSEFKKVVVENDPRPSNLFGKVEYEYQNGNLKTDFTKIIPGALHKANGGYLVLYVDQL